MSNLGNFVWSIADQLRGVYKPHQYGDVILPMTILRRLDCVLAASRDQVAEIAASEPREEIRRIKIQPELHNVGRISRWASVECLVRAL